MFCTRCGNAVPSDASVCSRCGASLRTSLDAGHADEAGSDRGRLATESSPAQSDTPISDEALWRAAIGKHGDYYLPRFAKFKRLHRSFPSWHWPAFFVAFWWALYRKLWAGAVLYFFLPFLVGAAVLVAVTILMPGDQTARSAANWIGYLLSSAIAAMLANGLYYRRIKARIDEARLRYPDATGQLAYLARKGGTVRAIVTIAVALTIGVFVVGVLAGIAVPAYRDYQTRSKVMEALSAIEPLKSQIASAWDSSKTVPRELDLRALRQTPGGQYVQNVKLDPDTVTITVTFGGIDERLNGRSIEWISSRQPGYRLLWACRNADSVPPQLIPPACRH
jgi:Tfp pilus assembly major pilin PilA